MMGILYLQSLLKLFTLTGRTTFKLVFIIRTRQNIIITLDFKDCADCLDTYLKTASKKMQHK